MGFRRFAPVHAGFIVMHGVVTIVEEQLVQEPNKISRMIEGGFLIGVDMLNIIEDKHAEKPNLLRNHDKQQRLFPIDNKCYGNPCGQQNILRDAVPEIAAIFLPLSFQVIANRFLLVITADGRMSSSIRRLLCSVSR